MQTKQKSRFLYTLFQFLAILIAFDGMRSNMLGGSFISILREVTILFLLFYTLCIKKFTCKNLFSKALIFFTIYHTIISFYTILFQPQFTIALIIKPYYLLISIYIFYYFEELTHRTYQEYIKFIIKTCIIFIFANTLFYFIPVPFIIEPHLWWGRISVSYPTMDVVTLSYALIFLMYDTDIEISRIKRICYMLIIFFGIFIQFSGTGIILLGIIFFIFLYYLIFSHQKTLKKENLTVIGIIIFTSSSLVSYIKIQFSLEYEKGMELVQNKINILSGDINENEFNTMEIRQNSIDQVKKKYINNEFSQLFGIGLGNATNNLSKLNKNKNLFMLEEQYSLINICYGYIGLSLFIMIILSFILSVYRSRIPPNLKIMFICAAFIFTANNKTLTSLILYPNYVFIALFFTLFKKQIYAYNYRLSHVGRKVWRNRKVY